MSAPCYKCEARTDRCHGDCEMYLTWLTERHEIKRKERQEKEMEQDLIAIQKAKCDRLASWMKKKR